MDFDNRFIPILEIQREPIGNTKGHHWIKTLKKVGGTPIAPVVRSLLDESLQYYGTGEPIQSRGKFEIAHIISRFNALYYNY